MNPPITCTTCCSNSSIIFPTKNDMDGLLGYGLKVQIDGLEDSAASGCQPCTLLLNFLLVFRQLSPSFEASYPERDPNDIFIQRSHAGNLLVALGRSGTYVDHLQMYTQIGYFPLWNTVGCAAEVPETLTLALATENIQRWASACQQHSCCTDSQGELSNMPNRILLLTNGKIILQQATGKRGLYTTLSHCWGTSQVLTTTSETLEERYSGIRWDDLPRIFQDAIALTRRLGIEYLWIDSLCIIQGDHFDWTRESANMAATFSNSYLNIAATSSSGSDGTLFSNRWTTPVPYEVDAETLPKRPMKSYRVPFGSEGTIIKARYSIRTAHENVKMLHNSRHMKRSDVTQKGRLLTRSWVFQERLLSPRTIHFHASEMIWECRDNFMCECGDLQETDPSMHDGYPTVGKRWLYELEENVDMDIYTIENRWLDGVELYSRLRITQCTDKLPALAGLVQRFGLKLQSRYLAGLWENDLPRSLCWKVLGEQKDGPETDTQMKYGKRCVPYCAPTWSWASVDLSDTGIESSFEARTAFEHIIMTGFVVDKRYELLSAECSTHPESPYGQVISGSLEMRAAVLSTILFFDDQYFDPDCLVSFRSGHHKANMDLDVEYLPSNRPSYQVKGFAEPRVLHVLLALLGGITGHEDGNGEHPLRSAYALVLIPVEGSQGSYQRIGLVDWPGSRSDFLNAEVRTIKIV